jgi:hypothetical protein
MLSQTLFLLDNPGGLRRFARITVYQEQFLIGASVVVFGEVLQRWQLALMVMGECAVIVLLSATIPAIAGYLGAAVRYCPNHRRD